MYSETNGDSKENGTRKTRRSQPSNGDNHNIAIKTEDESSCSTPHEAANIPRKMCSTPHSPALKTDSEATAASEIMVKLEPGKPPKLSKSSKKISTRPPQLFSHLPDATLEAQNSFTLLSECNYARKDLGTTDAAYECDCTEAWDSSTSTNLACGENSDCINRATRVECPNDCSCGANCQNQRFVQKQYSDVSVIKTEKKGYGLRANVDLPADALIYEYIGEVIAEGAFRKRLVQYDEEGIKHFYFMSLSKGEFIDATKKGNLGRFCNHSCNPNCYVDKWVVGDRLRMGIFTQRDIQAGEELVFNYNVDRYGANPQPCYCGEPNCTGFIGGKTQTERATKLSAATIEALGIEDGDDWDIAVASKKGRKNKKAGDDDEEYVDSLQPKSLDEKAVTKVMATLMQCKEKWIAVKLLGRIQRCDEERVRNRVIRMHGYQTLNTVLKTFTEDSNVALQVLDILHTLPRLTKNKIQDSKIEPTIEKLMDGDNEDVKSKALELLKLWGELKVAYRIPRTKRDPNAEKANERADRAERDDRRKAKTRSKSRSKSPDIPKGPSGPNSRQQPAVRLPPRPPYRRPAFVAPLPNGWFSAQSNGKTYFYSANGQTTWTRPSAPAIAPPPPPKEKTNEQKLQDIINSITQPSSVTTPQDKTSSNGTPQQVVAAAVKEEPKPDKKDKKEEKWRSYPEEKQMKVYENTIFPHIQHVMNKYKSRMPREDLKRHAKDVSKKLVASDYKNKRVTDPTQINTKQERNIKKYVKDFFDRAVAKNADREARKKTASTDGKADSGKGSDDAVPPTPTNDNQEVPQAVTEPNAPEVKEEDMHTPSDNEHDQDESPSANSLKRKRGDELGGEDTPLTPVDDDPLPSSKKPRDDSAIEAAVPPPPPPPPPPPAADAEDVDGDELGGADMEVDDEDEGEGENPEDVPAEQMQAMEQEQTQDQEPERPGEAAGDGSESFTREAREAVQAGLAVR